MRSNLNNSLWYNLYMKKPQFSEGQIYHVYNRGVEKRSIFLSDKDYRRFIHGLFEFNDEAPVLNSGYSFVAGDELQLEPSKNRERKLLVDIMIFTLMSNHFHLLLKQRVKDGVVKFMQKLGTGYTMYFNKKYDRVGGLFQGSFKAVLVNKQAHFLHLPYYIHTNPLELKHYRGRTSIENGEAIKFLESYRWSSFLDYIGIENFPRVTSRGFLLKFFEGSERYRENVVDWLKNRDESVKLIRDLILDD